MATYQVLSSHVWLVGIILNSTEETIFIIPEGYIGQNYSKEMELYVSTMY